MQVADFPEYFRVIRVNLQRKYDAPFFKKRFHAIAHLDATLIIAPIKQLVCNQPVAATHFVSKTESVMKPPLFKMLEGNLPDTAVCRRAGVQI